MKLMRNDDLLEAQESLYNVRPPRERGGLSKGWLQPSICWALYKQFGVLKALIGKNAAQAVAKGWEWKSSNIDYDWSGVKSDLEDLRLSPMLKRAIRWAYVEGGAGVVFRLDEPGANKDRPHAEEVVHERVRGINKIEVYQATALRPLAMGGGLGQWDTAELFELRRERNAMPELIHRSRLAPVVLDDIPIGGWSSTLYNTTTGWPPSWIEGIVDSLQRWRDSESTAGELLFTISLLVLELQGAREAYTSPSEEEREDFAALVDGIANNLSAHGLLALPLGDKLGEVGRNTGGVDKVLDKLRETFVADTGFSSQRVLQKAETGLGDSTSGMMRSDHETIEGIQEDVLVPAIDMATTFVLDGRKRPGYPDDGVEVPTRWVMVFNPLATQSPEEKAKARKSNADSRLADVKGGLPTEAALSDPELEELYPALREINAARALAAEAASAAELAAEADPTRPPSGEQLLSPFEVGSRLGVSAKTILAMRARGLIRGWKIGNRWRFAWSQVQSALGEELSAMSEARGELGDAARRAAKALRAGGRIDSETWDVLEPVLDGRFDALPPGLDLYEGDTFGTLWGASTAMREVFAVLDRVAPTALPVLVTGETGTGKEGAARGVHEASGRSGPFVAINCGTLGDDADEVARALLGEGTTPGPFEQAEGGTLFLDEVGELSDEGQAVLLRALAGDVRRVGGSRSVSPDVRIASATWRPVHDKHRGKFRPDLFERLAGVVVELPPLRDREDDVLELAARFVAAFAEDMSWASPPSLSSDARAVMLAHPWPGNVRELVNACRRGALFAGEGGTIEPEHLQLHEGRL